VIKIAIIIAVDGANVMTTTNYYPSLDFYMRGKEKVNNLA
jgi:hypothetical protein